MPTVIDSLIVTLGLDPKQFGTETGKAQTRIEKFDATVKKLGINETKLDASQKSALKSLRDVAAQSQRTGKELGAAGDAGSAFYGLLTKGAVGFAAALGLYSLDQFAKDTMNSVSAVGRLAAATGMSVHNFDTWGKAVQAMGGSADEAMGGIRSLQTMIAMAPSNGGADLIPFFGRLNMVTGGHLTPNDANHKPIPFDDQMNNIADAIHGKDPLKVHAILDPVVGFGMASLLFEGRAGMGERLKKAGETAIDSGDVAQMQKLQEYTTELGQAFTRIEQVLLMLGAPALILGVKNMLAVMQYWGGMITKEQYQQKVRANDEEHYGKAWMNEKDADTALGLMPSAGLLAMHNRAKAFADGKPVSKPWSQSDRKDWLVYEISRGESIKEAVRIVSKAEQDGPYQPVPVENSHAQEPTIDAPKPNKTARGILDNNPLNLKFANQKTAIGTDGPFAKFATPADGVTAASDQLSKYFARGKNTIRSIVSTWAPPTENDTEGYIKSVSGATGFNPNQQLTGDAQTIHALLAAMATRETGAAGNSSVVSITGPITIHTAATDGHALGRDFMADMRARASASRSTVTQATSGIS